MHVDNKGRVELREKNSLVHNALYTLFRHNSIILSILHRFKHFLHRILIFCLLVLNLPHLPEAALANYIEIVKKTLLDSNVLDKFLWSFADLRNLFKQLAVIGGNFLGLFFGAFVEGSLIFRLELSLLLRFDHIIITNFMVHSVDVKTSQVILRCLFYQLIQWVLFTCNKSLIFLLIILRNGLFRLSSIFYFACRLIKMRANFFVDDGVRKIGFFCHLDPPSFLQIIVICWIFHQLLNNSIY